MCNFNQHKPNQHRKHTEKERRHYSCNACRYTLSSPGNQSVVSATYSSGTYNTLTAIKQVDRRFPANLTFTSFARRPSAVRFTSCVVADDTVVFSFHVVFVQTPHRDSVTRRGRQSVFSANYVHLEQRPTQHTLNTICTPK